MYVINDNLIRNKAASNCVRKSLEGEAAGFGGIFFLNQILSEKLHSLFLLSINLFLNYSTLYIYQQYSMYSTM
jgi:hypothetical protein